ncbi:MAG TPA: T9SS type A sorting domain-containing protein [Bacteroidales bacterium]|nr:T9SS type A sorting domain-containing protein [Bacteroidales bacterium]
MRNSSNLYNLTINKTSSGQVSLGNSVLVNNAFTITNGLLVLGSANLTLLPATTKTISTPSASKMVVATGTGEYRKQYNSSYKNFTFDVGDLTSTAEFSPITINFSTGTFGASSYIGVKLVNSKHPQVTTSNYINRYWTASNSGISSFSCTVNGTYVDADITGTESTLVTAKYDGVALTELNDVDDATNLISGTVTGFSDFTAASSNCAPLNGIYTIGGTTPDYATFNAAVNALNSCGINGPVTFNVRTGTYNEQVNLSAVIGAGATNTITFQSETGTQADVILTYASSAAATNNYTLQITGADYFIWKNMTIERTGSNTYATVVNISGDASYNRFDNMIFSGRTGSLSNTAALVYSDDNNTGNANNTFDGCSFINGSAGIWYESTSTSNLKPNLTVQNSTFENYRYGMYLRYLLGTTITGNSFTNATSYNAASTQGIYAYYLNNSLSISKNSFIYTSATNNDGIELQACVGTASYIGDISNNMIVVGGTGTVNGINSGSTTAYKNYYFNSVYNTGTNSSSASAFYMNGSSNINIQNNILYSTIGMAIDIRTTSGVGTSDYNNLYSTGTYLGYWSANRADLAAWQSASGKDAHSVSGDPVFTSATDLHCSSGSAASNSGVVIAGISTDIDGNTRQTGTAPADGPDIGADEFVAASCTNPTLSGASQASSICGSGSATINLTGMVPNSTGNAIDYTINGVAQTQVTGITADGSGNASFATASLTVANDGQALVITKITNGSCFTNFSQSVTLSVKSLLNGDYTIGPAGDYLSFSAAVSHLMSCGVDPAATYVTFTATNGTYNEQVAIGSFFNPNNVTVTFQSNNGNQADVTLSYPSSASSTNNYTLQLNGTDHVVFKDMTIERTGTGIYAIVVKVSGDASNNLFGNVKFSGRTGSTMNDALVSSTDNNTGNTGNVFDDCYFYNGWSGVDWRGASGSPKSNITIQNSTFENYFIGISLHYVQGAIITGNHLTNSTTYDAVSNYGIFGYYANNGLSISKNYFKYNSSAGNYGIALSNCSGSSSYVGDISNNMIIVGSTYAYGIYVANSSYKNFYFNSVYNNGAYAAGYASFYMSSSSSVNVHNNIFYSADLYAINIESSTGGLSTCNYNNLFSTGSNLGNWGGIDCANLAAWQTTSGKDANSVSGNPMFTSGTDLHCTTGSASSNAGIVIAGISSDFDGDTRQTGTAPVDGPDIGADEFSECADLTWTGAIDTDWDTPGNWSCGIVPTNTSDITIPSVSNLPVVNSVGTSVCRSIVIDAGASVTVNSAKNLTVYGHWTNNGQSSVGSGTVIFSGSTAQSINGATTFGNLTINNANGVTLNNPTQVTGVLTPTLGTLASAGNLTLVSNALQTALIAGTGSGNVSGNVTMQRYMPSRLGYHYYSSPFNGASINEFADEIGTIITGNPYIGNDTTQTVTPFPNFFAYDETMGPTMSIGWTGAGSTLQTMRGYCINFGASATPLTTDVTGVVNNGNLSIDLTKTITGNTYADGWNLVGNPYPSPVDWQSGAWTKLNMNNAIYYFDAADQYTGTYSSFVNGIGNPSGTTGIIAAMQGFLVKATGAGSLGATNAVRISDLNPVFHKATQNNPILRLRGYPANNISAADETVIYFDPQASSMFDGNFDAYKMMNNNPAYPNIFTRDSTPVSLSIQALPPLSNTDVIIPLGYITKTNGNFTINASEILNFDPSLHIYLEDNQTSTNQDLTMNPVYTFTMNANAPQYRFFIRFSPSVITGIDQTSNSFMDAWSSGKDIFVNYSNTDIQNAEISVYNMLGQKVISAEQKGIGTTRYTVEEPGCYIIHVVSGNAVHQKKIVII